MKKLSILIVFLAVTAGNIFSQTDATPETKFNQSSTRKVSGNENKYSSFKAPSKVPLNLIQQYSAVGDLRNEEQKILLGKEIDRYLEKSVPPVTEDMKFIYESYSQPDWYSSDVLVASSSVAYEGGFRQMELKQGEDGWLYMAVNRRNIAGYNGYLSVYRSSDGGATWTLAGGVTAVNHYFGSVSMLVESRNNSVGDSTRILLYYTASTSSNFNNAALYVASFRRDGTAPYVLGVENPGAGNKFVNVTACSDGMFFSSATDMHAVVREETNAGAIVSLKHYRSTDWGANHSVGTINTSQDEKNPVCAYSNETGTDSIYIAVERIISANEREIRLITVSDIPNNSYEVRYVTDAVSGTIL